MKNFTLLNITDSWGSLHYDEKYKSEFKKQMLSFFKFRK